MAASTVNDTNFSDFALGPPDDRSLPVYFMVSVPTTSLDDVADRYNLKSIVAGKTITYIDILYSGAGDVHATPTLDADVVLSQEGLAAAAGTETVLFNAGTRFQAESSIFTRTAVNVLLADAVDSKAVVRLLVNVAAETPAVMPLSGIVWVK